MPPSVPPTIGRLVPKKLELSEKDLVVLWIHRTRHIAQAVLHLAWIQGREKLPPPLVTMARTSVRIIMDNMVTLARTSVEYGPYRKITVPKFFVPGEAFVLFALVEGFVDIFGYQGDEDAEERGVMFENMETLSACMRLHPSFSFGSIDFTGFTLTAPQLSAFGIQPGVPRKGLLRPLVPGTRARHFFGQDLLRYNPSLGPEGCYKIGLPSEILVPTRPNTPVSPSMTVILEDEEVSPVSDTGVAKPGPANLPGKIPPTEPFISRASDASSSSKKVAQTGEDIPLIDYETVDH